MNNLAVASLVLGFLWIFWLGSAAGLVLGLVAIRQINNRNDRGRGIAIAGIVLSAIGLAILFLGIGVAVTHSNSSGS